MKLQSSLAALSAACALICALPAQAHIVTYEATLTGSAENPAVITPGTGTVSVVVDDHNFTIRVITSFSDLLGTVTAAHIHCCTAAAFAGNAGVATQLPSFAGFPTGVTAGSYDQTFDMTQTSSWNPAYISGNGGTTNSAFSALITGIETGKAYLNIHTTRVGSGEIRGLLQAQAVPEPGSMALVLAAAGLALVTSQKRKST